MIAPIESEWRLLGTISVDGGRVVVGDPSYVRGVLNDLYKYDRHDAVGPQEEGLGRALAIIVWSGFGDGGYEVFERRTKRTDVVAELRVVFVPEGKDRCTVRECCGGRLDVRDSTGLLVDFRPCDACGGTGLVDA